MSMMKVRVKDVIAHLQTLPQDMEVWGFWDEAGTYHKLHSCKQGRVVEIMRTKIFKSDRFKWYQKSSVKGFKKTGKPKKVVVLDGMDEYC